MSAGARVLLVEDNPLNQKVVVRFLRSQGVGVDVAGSTEAAEPFLAAGTAAVVLLDLSLPGEDGLTFVRRLRGRGVRLPIVAVTAHAMPGDRERALEAGCTGYLAKPVELWELLSVVTDHLEGGVA